MIEHSRPKEQVIPFQTHKIANVLNAVPKSAQPGAKAALADIWQAEDKEHAHAAAKGFAAGYGITPSPRRPRRSPTTSTCC